MAHTEKTAAVIGGGPGGYSAALYLAQLGFRVTLAEQRPYLGGVCLNEGCIPTKAFVQASSVYAQALDAERYGVIIEGPVRADAAKAAEHKRAVVSRLRRGVGQLLRRAGVRIIHGRGELLSPGEVKILTGTGGEYVNLRADAILLATGSREIEIPGFAADGSYILNSTQMLDMERFPASIIIIGGGVIGVEFACVLQRFGVRVTVVELTERLLPTVDAEIAKLLEKELTSRGVTVMTGTAAERVVEKTAEGVRLLLRCPDGEKRTLRGEQVLVCVGRRPNLEGLGLEAAGIRKDRQFVATNEKMQTSAESVYAVGDITASPQLAHVAYYEALVAAKNIAGKKAEADYRAVPSCIFSHPEAACTGLSEEEARAKFPQTEVFRAQFAGNGKAMLSGENKGLVKLVTEGPGRTIVGASVIGPGTTGLVAELTLAAAQKLSAEGLAGIIHAHPSLSETVGEAASAALGLTLHG